MPLIRDVGIWIWAVLRVWQSYVTGGVLVGLLLLYEKFGYGQISNDEWKYGLLLFFIVATFLTWRDQKTKHDTLDATLRANTNKTVAIMLISNAHHGGSALSSLTPSDMATDEEVAKWREEVDHWRAETSALLSSLSLVAQNKFSEIHVLKTDASDAYHWKASGARSILNTQLENLQAVIEKPDVYLLSPV